MTEAVSLTVRYETKGADGRTRRERNVDFGHSSPDIEVPSGAEYLWETFWSIRRGCGDGFNAPNPMSPRHILDWQTLTGDVLSRPEAVIVLDMDRAYLSAWQVEADNNEAMERARNG